MTIEFGSKDKLPFLARTRRLCRNDKLSTDIAITRQLCRNDKLVVGIRGDGPKVKQT